MRVTGDTHPTSDWNDGGSRTFYSRGRHERPRKV